MSIFMSLINFGNFLVIISPIIFSTLSNLFSPSVTTTMPMLVLLLVSYGSLQLCSLSLNLFSFHSSHVSFHCPVFKLGPSFSCLLKSAFEYLQLLCFSSLQFLCFKFLLFTAFSILLIHNFLNFHVFSFSSLSIFKIVVLKFSSGSVIKFFSGTFHWSIFHLNEIHFSISLYALCFFVENWTFTSNSLIILEI